MREDALSVQGKTVDSQRKKIKGDFFGVFRDFPDYICILTLFCSPVI
jgi:hypothetical protein